MRATSLEDISLKSLAPASAMDSAALRARLHDAHTGTSARTGPLGEDAQGAAGYRHLCLHRPCMMPAQQAKE